MAQINKPTDYFRVKTYTGNSTNNTTITWDETDTNFGTNLLLWLKQRTVAAQEHWLTDSIRGGSVFLESNSTNAESDAGGNWGYATNGFVLDDNARTNRGTMVGWGWNTSGSASSNTDGSITSSVSANTTSGFSIVSYTGNGTAGATVGHGLSAVPKMLIVKRRNTTGNWGVYHESIGNTNRLYLNDTSATSSGNWNNTTPTSSVFTIDGGAVVNGSSDTYIAYCFAEKKGYSKFGSYTGNGSTDGTFIYTGFKPSYFLLKSSSNAESWHIYDNQRANAYNPHETYAPTANASSAEATASSYGIDFVSNGVKLRGSGSGINGSGYSYIYMAFAENPLVGTNNIPATAR